MLTHVWLTYYCVLILLASIVGGMIPVWIKLTHRWMELAVSFVAGIMFGVATLHMLPHALATAAPLPPAEVHGAMLALMVWFVAGFVAMFLIERFFCFHHHDAPEDERQGSAESEHEPGCSHDQPHSDHVHDITWSGAAVGLTLHSLLAGVALAASVTHGSHGGGLPGLGVFLVIFLHKPFDAMTIGTLMARSGWSLTARCVVNALFSLAIPAGAMLFFLGFSGSGGETMPGLPPALAFSAGVFLCIAGSDLLPELQFHHHDRLKLSVALAAGLAIAYMAGRLEGHTHEYPTGAKQSGKVINVEP
ncbi:MAG: ZIP family metal transporter [Aeoliella sp.]